MDELKFKQIQACGVENNSGTQSNSYLFGLTEEGQVYWATDGDYFNTWSRIKTVPYAPPTSQAEGEG